MTIRAASVSKLRLRGHSAHFNPSPARAAGHHGLEHSPARFLAAAASRGAKATVLVHLYVALAFFSTDSTRLGARLELLANQGHVRISQASKDIPG